jgi:predicted dithiol-disulfide oxidoreductase (DUF899 family)
MEANKAVYNFVEQEPHARGIDLMCTDYNYLDLTPKGRDEGGRGPYWVKRHDEYEGAAKFNCCG